MRFRSDNFPSSRDKIGEKRSDSDELADTVTQEHPKHIIAVAEQRIMTMHHHKDGSPVELHEVSSREFIAHSMASSSLEGRIGGSLHTEFDEKQFWQQNTQGSENPSAAARIEYERKSAQNQPTQSYGAQHSVTGAAVQGSGRQETAMVGCNCGAEWTVTGQRTRADSSNPAGGVKIEQYSSASGGAGAAGYSVSSGAGGERIRYAASGSQQQEYKG